MAKPSKKYAKNPNLLQLGKTIRELRVRAGYSQDTFALEVGIDRSYFGGIERGEHNLTILNLLRISKLLNLNLCELFKIAKL